jgi:hypothetical protein
MKKLILRTSIFILPFATLLLTNKLFYKKTQGDLIRLGLMYYDNPITKNSVNNHYKLPKSYSLLSEIDLTIKNKYKIITIGDSFSEGDLSYKNFIANKGISTLHIDRFISGENPIQTLIELINSNFFEHVSADYIILQTVEREFIRRTKRINFKKTINLNKINNPTKKKSGININTEPSIFNSDIFKIPLVNIQYLYKANPSHSKVYKYKSTSENLFSNGYSELLFFYDDINTLNEKNDPKKITQGIKVLEKINDLLEVHNIKLITLISPDKYDLYYPFIKNKYNLKKPLFFQFYESAQKKHLNINSYNILTKKINSERDIYHYGDTHWTPKAAKIIAGEIYNIIE